MLGGLGFLSSPEHSYLLVSILLSEEFIVLTSNQKEVCFIRPLVHRSGGYWSLTSDWCRLVPYMSVRQREIEQINDSLEFPRERLEMLFWISQNQKWKDTSLPPRSVACILYNWTCGGWSEQQLVPEVQGFYFGQWSVSLVQSQDLSSYYSISLQDLAH